MINLTIDDKEIEVPEGTTVLEAAQKLNIDIPTLCHDPRLKPYGACRLCIVEIAGMAKPVTSCTTPATKGMIVKTNSARPVSNLTGVLGLKIKAATTSP